MRLATSMAPGTSLTGGLGERPVAATPRSGPAAWLPDPTSSPSACRRKTHLFHVRRSRSGQRNTESRHPEHVGATTDIGEFPKERAVHHICGAPRLPRDDAGSVSGRAPSIALRAATWHGVEGLRFRWERADNWAPDRAFGRPSTGSVGSPRPCPRCTSRDAGGYAETIYRRIKAEPWLLPRSRVRSARASLSHAAPRSPTRLRD